MHFIHTQGTRHQILPLYWLGKWQDNQGWARLETTLVSTLLSAEMTYKDLMEAADLIGMLEDHFGNVVASGESLKSDRDHLKTCRRVRKAIKKYLKENLK